jgi:dienelactone hydrolase
MLKFSRGLLGSVLLATASIVAAPAVAERAVTDFTDHTKMAWAKISPDGSRLVAEMKVDGVNKLIIMPLGGSGAAIPIGLGEGELAGIYWVGNDWLLANVLRRGHFNGYEGYMTRLVSFRADGTGMRILQPPEGLGFSGGTVRWVAKDGSPQALIEYSTSIYIGDEGFWPRVARVDIERDRWKPASNPMESITNWYADSSGAVRMGTGIEKGGRRSRLVYREGDSGLFKEISAVDSAAEDQWLPVPELFLRDNKALTISRHEGYAGVYEVDLATMKIGAKVYGKPGYDVTGILNDPINPHGLRGIAWYEDHSRVLWFDPKFQGAQQMIEQAFPGGDPQIESSTHDGLRHVVHVSGGEKAGYYVLDMTAKRLTPIMKLGNEDLWPAKRSYRYKARDGLEIEAYLTFPGGQEAKNLPVILMPHGGPRARDTAEWDGWAQFFADRGYLVIQPNYRGSTGYGVDFERAGLGEWGLKMQDDVDDALAWAAKEGYADAGRACVIGGSYGGYVAMRAAQRNPELYKCAISFAGVSSLPAMMRQDQNSYFSGSASRDYWKGQVDDLKSVSPVHFPEQFGIPILLVHGEKDFRVPVEHSREMYSALKKAGKQVEYLEQPKNDHHFTRDEDMHEFLLAAEKFLDKYNPAGPEA